MTRKILFILMALIFINTMPIQGIAKDKPIPKPSPPIKKDKYLAQQQTKIEKVRNTKEGQEIFKLVNIYSKKYNVDPKLVHAVILAESGYDKRAKSKENAQGLMQLKPYPNRLKSAGCRDLYNKQCNIKVGTAHLSNMLVRYNGNEDLALSAYLLGGGAVKNKVPKSARPYVNKVKNYKTLY